MNKNKSMIVIDDDDIEELKKDIDEINWKRETLSSMKNYIGDWLDYNLEHEITPETIIQSQESEDRLYFMITEENNTNDEYPRFQKEYFCVFQKFDRKSVEEVE